MGESLVGPSVIVHGTPEQRAHFLPRHHLRRGRVLPGFLRARPRLDLAGVADPGRGRRRRDRGHRPEGLDLGRAPGPHDVHPVPDRPGRAEAPRPFLRADPVHADHGVEYRPIRQMSGAGEFCEDFIDGARAPLFNVIGGLDNGWRVAMTTLGTSGAAGPRRSTLATSASSGTWSTTPASTARTPTRWSASSWPGPIPASSSCGTRAAHAGRLAAGRAPGPEAGQQAVLERVPQAARRHRDRPRRRRRHDPAEGPATRPTRWQNGSCASRAGTIYSGTSEIQRNIIGERALGLPKGGCRSELTVHAPRHSAGTARPGVPVPGTDRAPLGPGCASSWTTRSASTGRCWDQAGTNSGCRGSRSPKRTAARGSSSPSRPSCWRNSARALRRTVPGQRRALAGDDGQRRRGAPGATCCRASPPARPGHAGLHGTTVLGPEAIRLARPGRRRLGLDGHKSFVLDGHAAT